MNAERHGMLRVIFKLCDAANVSFLQDSAATKRYPRHLPIQLHLCSLMWSNLDHMLVGGILMRSFQAIARERMMPE